VKERKSNERMVQSHQSIGVDIVSKVCLL